ncbi:MAG: PAS domain-containing protein, partial [Myxococcota bacterium]
HLEISKLRRVAEDARQRLHAQFMQAPVAVAVFRGPEFVYELVNSRYTDLFGEREYLGHSVRRVFSELSPDAPPFKMLEGVYASAQPFVADEYKVSIDRKSSGILEDVYLHFTCQPIIDPQGQVMEIMAVAVDVTERVLARQRIQQVQQRLTFAMEAAGVGYWDLDMVSEVIVRSPSHERIFGDLNLGTQWTFQEFLECVVPDDRGRIEESFQRAKDTGKDWRFECQIRRGDSTLRWIAAHLKCERLSDNESAHMLGVVSDITDRKQFDSERDARMEELARTVRFSEIFIGILGHDLRNPLNAITLAANLLEMQLDSTPMKKPVSRILGSAHRMERMISQLLDFTRIRLGGGIPIVHAPVELKELSQAIIDELEPVYG